MKKAQGLPVSTIILVIIGLVVLIVLIAMVIQKAKQAGQETKEITEQECKPPVGVPAPIGECEDPIYGTFKNLRPDQICCKVKK